jgi:hypothetical protein
LKLKDFLEVFNCRDLDCSMSYIDDDCEAYMPWAPDRGAAGMWVKAEASAGLAQ